MFTWLTLGLLLPTLGLGQGFGQLCGTQWANKMVPEFVRIQDLEQVKQVFGNRPARVLPLPFFRAAYVGFASSGSDTTLLGQNLSRSFAAALALQFREKEVLNSTWEVLPPLENSIFQSQFVFVKPDQYARETEENRRRLLELQPDFLLCGEYELTPEGLGLLRVNLQRVAHPGNPFKRQEITIWSGKMDLVFTGNGQYAECKAKDIKPFDARPFLEMMHDFHGTPIRRDAVIQEMILKDDHTFALDSVAGDLKTGTYYKLQIRLPAPLYVYAFSYEAMDAEKQYLYFIQNLGGNQTPFKMGKTIFPAGNAGFGFSVPPDFEEGYQLYFKLFALEEPVSLLTQDQKKKGETISWLSPEMAKRFLNQVKEQKAKGKKVYTAELVKFLEK
jgi:hypothetical protein